MAPVIHTSSPRAEQSYHDFLTSITTGWWVLAITILTTFPWAIISVWDAIDSSYRTLHSTGSRLFVSTFCLVVAYVLGILFCLGITIEIFEGTESARHDDVATILVLLIFNMWHVIRNIKGWLQFFAIRKITQMFCTLQTNFANNFPGPYPTDICVQGLMQVRVSNRLFDNEWRSEAPFLAPWFTLRADLDHLPNEDWAVAMWRAWWTQDTTIMGPELMDLSVADHFLCDKQHRYINVENLLDSEPSWPARPVIDDRTGEPIKNKVEWADALTEYGGNEGQQDTHGELVKNVIQVSDARGIAILVQEKTSRLPNRMSALWYQTARFEDAYHSKIFDMRKDPKLRHILFPRWGNWLKIALDITTNLPRPMYLSDTQLIVYAGELASTSVILTAYPEKYLKLVEQIYADGLNSRWTFGWSGLLACFTHLWTKERIYIAMLNGLSFLALTSAESVGDINQNVRCMLYGYAAFEVSDRAVGKRIANDRKAELLKRYSKNKGKTCRGSGLCAIRLACEALELPAEASHMDGLPAFSSGWCSEYMERKPGNQAPEHGGDHDEVECLQGSSNVWRYPHSHT